MKNKFILLSLLGSIHIGTGSTASADTSENGLDYTSPYVDPQQNCLTDGMINPPDKNFRYLYSRDCRVVHVLPPTIMPQNIRSQGVNLRACKGLQTTRSTLNTIEQTIDETDQRLRRLESELEKANSNQKKIISSQIEALSKRREDYVKNLEQTRARLEKDYYQLPGAVFSIAMDSSVNQNDLTQLRALNMANLNRRRTIVEKSPDGKSERRYEVVDISSLRPAQITQSYFSFLYNVPADAGKNGGVISTDIPNLEYLEQPGSRTGVIHVKANGGVSGKVVLSLTTACDRTKINEAGDLVLDESTDPFFTVNQTFFVQQMYAQGYVAKLKVDKTIDQITKFVSTHTNQGFKKSSVFLPVIKGNVDQILEFNWTSEFDAGKNISFDKILEIKNGVAAKLIDDYIENLTKAGIITVVPDKPVTPAEGGYVDETRVANRCWTERDGGLSGMFGGRHRVCGDYTYTVKVWRDGITEEEIRRSLRLSVESVDSMSINAMAPFYFTTAFIK